ncbi:MULTISPECIES: N-acetyl-1-D-myo-inositol-2-amino-2-deoxy-alpha-D-glucopyranoside deacetylase [Mumia]|uniref:N-acetyl-1-D-myo-inositol-2-amino-2-deoxy-alpha- D-glucopyranoside deacetylase n=1 Tax=Mumia TaxID=1546255 RepID=UPI0014224AA3|nr:N-acetyl-1-D-myo-inositol-2-amino-2-deoxy-alpha-D-glucopyranoside deacetylase [Mumia sp. ZJ430]
MPEDLPDRRLLLVHAHPDDETIATGVIMAKYAAEGVGVTLVTCTLGEEGEVLVPELAHLASDRDDQLGAHRITERDAAMKILGVTDARWLGGAGTYRDSGMVWSETGAATVAPDVPANAFWLADLREAADHLVAVIREVRPQVLVTYDDFGNYGHPDHVQAHRVATYAVALAAVPSYRRDLGEPWDVAKVYWTTQSESWLRDGLRRLREAGDHTTFEGMDPEGDLSFMAVPDDKIAAVVTAEEYAETKLEAMRAYPTQIQVDSPFFALSNNLGAYVWGSEFFRIAKGTPVPDDDGFEHDLFAGTR